MRVNVNRIGHLLTDTITYLEILTAYNDKNRKRLFVFQPNIHVSNKVLRDKLKKHVTFISSDLIDILLRPLTWNKLSHFDGSMASNTNEKALYYQAKHENGYRSRFSLTNTERMELYHDA